ncbi:3-dehydroquinate synthase [Rubritalea marina]|uniref:3-dehydroquinate synthase n=1 Tax=Rubritalea marina TaxID=361055 RepID=UPI0003601F19|nr:3-dehydroquinate synthase [Rubritalea marina]
MATVHVHLDKRSYDVICEYGALDSAAQHIASLGLTNKAAIITDSNVGPHYASQLIAQLSADGINASLHTVAAGEASKSMSNVEELCRQMTREGHDRSSWVIALGGGVVGDLAGFVASVFYRGVPFVQIPTTIVSLVDSSVGGKTGVNIAEGKNLVGAFHQPRMVLADPATLSTLAGREYREGYAEAIKHAAIRDADMLAELEALDPLNQAPPAELIARNIAIKARVVEEDEKETSGTRALLNFGHTIGHGIEASVPYGELLHGEAISLGIRAALILSEQFSSLSHAESQRVLQLLQNFQLPLTLPNHIDTATVLEKMKRDKKFSGGKINFVLLDTLGSAFVSKDVTWEAIEASIELLRQDA